MNKLLPTSLHGRFVLALLVSFLAITLLGGALLFSSTVRYQNHITQIMHRDLAKYVAEHYTFDKDGKFNVDNIKHTFHNLMILGPNFEFYILDTEGEIIAFSAEKKKIQRQSVSLNNIKNYHTQENISAPLYGDDPRKENRKKVFSAYPIYKNESHLGYVYVILGSEIYDQISNVLFESKMVRWGFSMLILGLIFWLLVLLWVSGMITRPLKKLTHQVERLSKSGFSRENITNQKLREDFLIWDKRNKNEIHVLGTSFRQSIDTLSDQYKKVVTIDELRQELLSHISHDLRTPLASLLGYLETWELNKDSLTKEESEHYIGTAKVNAKKISLLIEQLFELAHLDSENVQVNKEKFAIAELIQDVIYKFDIQAKKKSITLDVNPKDSSILVFGDIEKLERAFTNLIENAIRHTNRGGHVLVKLSPFGRFINVEVSDTGIGIPESDLPHIFEPHFKAGNSVRENTAHGGLGLAITKKLLNLHETTIQVHSELNRGTTFEFLLPSSS